MRMDNRWSPEDDAILRVAYGSKGSAAKIGSILNRTVSGIHKRAHRLELTTTLNKKPWSEKDLAYLIENYPKVDGDSFYVADLAKALERGESSVQHQAARNGLTTEAEHHSWNEDEIKVLRDNYWKMSIDDLSKVLGRSESSVQHKLFSLGISDRHLHFTMTPELRVVLDGLLIGDGNYRKNSEYSASFRLNQKSTHKDWVDSLVDIFTQHQVYTTTNIMDAYQRTTKKGIIINASEQLHLYTASYTTLLPEHQRWYPEGVKIVPRDIDISNPVLLAHWYMGDGTTSINKKRNYMYGALCTNGFTEDDVNWLRDELRAKLNIKASIKKVRIKEFVINMANFELEKFHNIVRGRLNLSFEYKTPTNPRTPPICTVCNKQLIRGIDGYKYCVDCQKK